MAEKQNIQQNELNVIFNQPENSNNTNSIRAKIHLHYPGQQLEGVEEHTCSMVAKAHNFKGNYGEHFSYVDTENNIVNIVFGLGKLENLDVDKAKEVGVKLATIMMSLYKHIEWASLDLASLTGLSTNLQLYILIGFYLRHWRFEHYKTKAKVQKLNLDTLSVNADRAVMEPFNKVLPVLRANHYVRTLSNTPANIANTEYLAEQALSLMKRSVNSAGKLSVKVLEENEMQDLGMNALLCVGQGSKAPSKLVAIEYKNNPDTTKVDYDMAFVGKGIVFDTGGISIKPSNNMHEMKHDMTGAATVLGIMKSLSEMSANDAPKMNIVGVLAIAENMCSGEAIRPGDVVTAADGQTIEILNTDAEGRLVLADALWYAQKFYKPEYIIDYATLTGAVGVALGNIYAGLFSNDDDLAKIVFEAGEDTGELAWRLPLHEKYDRAINSSIADMQNIGKSGAGAGSTMGAVFLQRFVQTDTNKPHYVKWAHLDIAYTGYRSESSFGAPAGSATGYGVLLAYEILKSIQSKR